MIDGCKLRFLSRILGLPLLATGLFVQPAAAQELTLNLGGAGVSERALQLIALLTVLALAPTLLIMMTSFTRIVVALSLLRSALGTQSAPPNMVLIALALFLTGFVMSPTLEAAYNSGVKPYLGGEIREKEAFERTVEPLHAFMLKNAREKDIELFVGLSRRPPPETPAALPLTTLLPAFMISELRRAFEIGFLLFLPFLVIDLIVASILISMGMMMIPPVMVALPFKLIFFVLVDGWRLVAGSLVQSFAM